MTHDPYFSIWSASDELTGSPTRHWTGYEQPLSGFARIDGKPFRFMGSFEREIVPMKQVKREVTPTRTIFDFEAAGIALRLSFITPALPTNLDVLSRPVTYVQWEAKSTDGKTHEVDVYLDASTVISVNTRDQKTTWSRVRAGNVQAVRAGSQAQSMLERSGDDLRIEWGQFYLAVPTDGGADISAGNNWQRRGFLNTGKLPPSDSLEPYNQRDLTFLATAWNVKQVGAQPVSRYAMLAYDDVYSIQFLQRNLRPYWRRNGMGVSEMLQAAAAEFPSLAKASADFDAKLTADLVKAGGDRYAAIAVLAYRQALAAHKLVADLDGEPLLFSKENFSNGCIATVDVTYPSAPLFLLVSPKLHMALLKPILEYALLPRWKFPFAPHDIGQYPLANGQVYGGGERTEENQMPVEESGNILILAAAHAQVTGSAEFAKRYWVNFTKWAEYLRDKGMDPENQLSTDDFAGHLAHNTNLSIKAIVALGAYARLASQLGETAKAAEYTKLAKEMAAKWGPMALDGDHYKLAFDKPGTWSQKYNLVWDTLLGLNLFDPKITRTEMAYYLKMQNKYGLPLDNRETYTKLDWIIWTATMAQNRQEFEALVNPVFDFLNESTSRVPMSDWYQTTTGKQVGFQARSVVGGVFIPLLKDATLWKKWSSAK